MPVARWVLPVPGGPRKTTFSFAVTKVEGAQVRDDVPGQAAGVVEVELLQRFSGGEPRRADAALTAVGLAGGDLALQARGEELLEGPPLGAGPLGQPRDRLAERGCLQRAGQERQLGGHVPARGRMSTSMLSGTWSLKPVPTQSANAPTSTVRKWSRQDSGIKA